MSRSHTSNLISRTRNTLYAFATLAAVWVAAPSTALAVPVLQIYVEGATYDSTSETWVLDTTGTGDGGTARVWVIGNVDGAGGQGTISDVTLVVSYDHTDTTPTIDVNGSTSGGLGGFTDPSVAADGVL